MNWEAIGAVGEILGAVAVLITLVYLARQIKQLSKQNYLESFQHYQDQLNAYLRHISESEELSRLVVKGRKSLDGLDEAERLRFDYVHFQLLNFIESCFTQANHTSLDESYRQWVLQNLDEIVKGQLGYPGCIAMWRESEEYFEQEVRDLINRSIE